MRLFQKFPYFLFLLPVFFVVHGYQENYNFVPAGDALLLVGIYMLAALLLFGLAWLLFRNANRAALLALSLLSFNFFFGSVHDRMLQLFPDSFISRYGFMIAFPLCLMLALVLYLHRKKPALTRVSGFLGVLLVVLILLDTAMLGIKMARMHQKNELPAGMVKCPDCNKPDIYLILADEYVGASELKDEFGFDNNPFLDSLAQRGFYNIPNTRSNYNFTPFSVASTLNMDYLPISSASMANRPELSLCYRTIRDNNLLHFLKAEGYGFYNYSIFDFEGQPASLATQFLPSRTKLITGQTFVDRFNRDLRFNLVTRLHSRRELSRITYGVLQNNEQHFEDTWKIAETVTTAPKFVYTHLHLPHYPYYYDSVGNAQPFEKLLEGNQVNKEMYRSYLQYGNRKYLELIDHILASSKKPPIIILMGDHGFRHFTEPVDPVYQYLNQVSVLLPDREYQSFSDSLTNVNVFRVLLNGQFRQQLPMLRDTTYFVVE